MSEALAVAAATRERSSDALRALVRVPSLTGEDGKGQRYVAAHLRPGVKWHDGQPFTSADVKFSKISG